jgi:hypothetical protein
MQGTHGRHDAQDEVESIFGTSATRGFDGGARSVEHVFTLLSLALEREPLKLAYLALATDARDLRGTALEYLDVVLPERVRGPVLRLVGGRTIPPPARRSHDQVRDELLRSHDSRRIDVAELGRRPLLTKPK